MTGLPELGDWFHNISLPGGVTTIHSGNDYPAPLWNRIKPHLGNLDGQTVLDIGCNGGFMMVECARAGAKVCGIEELEKYCRQSRFALEALELDGEVIHGDIFGSELDGRRFDVVLCLGVLYHVWHPMKLLEKIRAFTSGIIVIETDTSGLPGRAIELFADKPAGRPTPEALRFMMDFAKLTTIHDEVWIGARHIVIAI